ncbi:MAG: DUF3159 domain-containing protein [Hamadaea sp.]|uniref:DUF3159 domain-containing protein n=1 Tax=Hamadaea sp. TaxID=2024425 RepID=UPI001843C0B0|nr:DUF3159 domain-containing protein [Hamadaea sp.]NUR70800.1 DUF3159 domain-containing protein [Hamadaea sp.]NUT19491.1 DUF3159 domain-containing protein [Hamadaea sp.]
MTDPGNRQDSLHTVLGGYRGAVDATVGPLAYVAGYLAGGKSIAGGAVAAGVATVGIGLWRWRRGGKLTAVLLGALGVGVAATIALYTGRSSDFFLARLASNVVSALAWAVSIVARWPLLGVVVGAALGQKTRWRKDPWLLRGYQRASWIWVGQYAVRIAVFTPLWLADQTTALGLAQAALTWPLVAACLGLSWLVLRKALPEAHPGIRHPVTAESLTETPDPDRVG